MAQTVQLTVGGGSTIHCEGCEDRIGKALKRMLGVETVSASHTNQQVTVTFDPDQVTVDQIRAKLAQAGFETESNGGIGGASPDRKGLGKGYQPSVIPHDGVERGRTGSPIEGGRI